MTRAKVKYEYILKDCSHGDKQRIHAFQRLGISSLINLVFNLPWVLVKNVKNKGSLEDS